MLWKYAGFVVHYIVALVFLSGVLGLLNSDSDIGFFVGLFGLFAAVAYAGWNTSVLVQAIKLDIEQ